MQELLPTLIQWQQAGQKIAIAIVVKTTGSAPRPLGAKMAVNANAEMAGSVSGGCVEGAVVQEALAVLATNTPRLVEYGIGDELAQSVGLACGGMIQVWIAPLDPALLTIWQQAARERRALVVAWQIEGEQIGDISLWSADGWHKALPLPALAPVLAPTAATAIEQQRAQRVAAQENIFLDAIIPPPRIIIIGAVHIAIHLVGLARVMGYYTMVLDARSAFATEVRFPHAHKLIVGWPADQLEQISLDASTYVVCLTHDDKIDLPVLAYALKSNARYVGALGGRRMLAQRLDRLVEEGVDPALFARLHAPIGLDIGGRQPEEIALAIMAEIVSVRNGRENAAPTSAEVPSDPRTNLCHR
jgi:xanthine dehydrogenase accessory factor